MEKPDSETPQKALTDLDKDVRIAELEMRCHGWFQRGLLMSLAIDDLTKNAIEYTQDVADAEKASKLFKDYYRELQDKDA